MSKLQPDSRTRNAVISEVVEALQTRDYTLNTVNSYGENLLHVSVANECFEITKEILAREERVSRIINRKNKFGWTPLMLAVRNRDVGMVKLLLENGANVNDTTYHGMSVIGLACGINRVMFETVYQACPTALSNAANDDITPLCIAAMKNDKELFFQLLDLGLHVSEANEYTQRMMSRSNVPEIASLAQQPIDGGDYWNSADNIPVETDSSCKERQHSSKSGDKENSDPARRYAKPVFVFDCADPKKDDSPRNSRMNPKLLNMNVLNSQSVQENLISPNLTFTSDKILSASPNICFTQRQKNERSVNVDFETGNKTHSILQRLQSIRPLGLEIENHQEDPNISLGYVPGFSPIRSPHVPSDISDENVYGENTPTPPRYRTPPRGVILNSEARQLFILLKHYGLTEYFTTFVEQEVDIGLFVTLTESDLIEIGIKNEAERKSLLAVITDYNMSNDCERV